MTVAALRKALEPYDEHLDVFIRCDWDGETPSGNVFTPHLATQDIDHDSGEDFLAIECDQNED
jgi:hypothetical protein